MSPAKAADVIAAIATTVQRTRFIRERLLVSLKFIFQLGWLCAAPEGREIYLTPFTKAGVKLDVCILRSLSPWVKPHRMLISESGLRRRASTVAAAGTR
jgi:hypothetical protein